MITFDCAREGPAVMYPVLVSAIVPRPTALISTVDKHGVRNLAPYSYFNIVAHDPPHVVVGICMRDDGTKKDSLKNVEENKEFVVNMMSEWYAESANFTCGGYGPEVDEMQVAGLTPIPSMKVKPARVAESAVQMECVLKHSYEVHNSAGTHTTTIVIGEATMVHISEGVREWEDGEQRVSLEKLQPVSTLGGTYFGRTNSIFEMPRPEEDTENQS